MKWQNEELVIALVVSATVLIAIILLLRARLRRLTRGGKTTSIESSLTEIENDIKSLKDFNKETAQYLGDVEKRLSRSIQGIGVFRFNPFKGAGDGGNQSFATSFISERGNGVVISSIYAREHRSVFGKPIKNFKGEYELTPEENESLAKAREEAGIKS